MDTIGLGKRNRYFYVVILILLIFLLEYSLFSIDVNATKKKIDGLWTEDSIKPKERVSYEFMNNNTFEVSTDTYIHLYIEYENGISFRQTYFIINNSAPISLNISSKSELQNFGIDQAPQQPKRANYQFKFGYNCIIRLRSNTSISNLTISYKKNQLYNIDPDKTYSLAIFESSVDSWELVNTIEFLDEASSEKYLESNISNLQQETDYYITLIEVGIIQTDWSWLVITIVVIVIGIASLVILISKKDYFQYLKTRTVPIEKGAHRLSLDEVLENENRNKIIELILTEPGIHFNELLRKTGLAAGNLVWHLDILQTYKIIGKKRIGNFIAYFPYYQKNPISNVDLKLQKSKLTLEILEMIEDRPGIWNNLITKKFKVDHKTIQYHLNKLKELDLIRLEKEGRKKKIYPNLDSDYFNQDI
ncbi:MAG: winged helix-turn-helix transcriptional regulator [Candidatus Hodarchaeota archaeon]